MKNRIVAAALLIGGLALVIAGLVVMLLVVPGMKKLPTDTVVERTYKGRMKEILDPVSFILDRGVPVQLVRSFRVDQSTDVAALVSEERTLTAGGSSGSGGRQLEQSVSSYAVDRRTMLALPQGQYPAAWNDAEGLWPRQGLVLGWPIDTQKRDYVGWSDDYRATVPLVYRGQTTHARSGTDTYKFTSAGAAQPIVADQVAAMGLPTELGVDQVVKLIAGTDLGPLGAIIEEQLPEALRDWAQETVPLQYFYAYQAEYWIEPRSGIMLDTRKHERRTVGLGDAFIAGTPLVLLPESARDKLRLPVSDFTYTASAQSVADASEEARSVGGKLSTFGIYLPLALIAVGALDLAAAGFFLVRRRPAA